MARIEKLRDYLINVIDDLTKDTNYIINANFLGDVGDFSLDKIPTESQVEKWILGLEIHRDVYSFRSRKYYSQDIINNLTNAGFFELFEEKIKELNDKQVLPNIKGIESIECLNHGTIVEVDGTNATFDIQIEIKYRQTEEEGGISL